DIELAQYFANFAHGSRVINERPLDDVQVLTTQLEHLDDRIEQRRGLERPTQNAEVALLQLDPKSFALQVFEPTMSQETIPVLANPHANRHVAQVMACLFTFDPLVF